MSSNPEKGRSFAERSKSLLRKAGGIALVGAGVMIALA